MDAFYSYHHIPLYLDNQEKTIFIIDKELYCYMAYHSI